jgi:hypothetical protein
MALLKHPGMVSFTAFATLMLCSGAQDCCRQSSETPGATLEAKTPNEATYAYDRTDKNRSGLKESDVCLSCRGLRKPPTTNPSAEAVRLWQPTRIEWSYIADPKFIQSIRARGIPFVGALNTIEHDGPAEDEERLDGSRMVAPWMVKFRPGGGVGWACVNKPATLESRIKFLKTFVDQDVSTLQFDDWSFNLHAYEWGGGCFCTYCRQGFADYLAQHATADERRQAGRQSWAGFDYRRYLKTKFGWTTPQQLIAGRKKDPLDHHFRDFQRLSTRKFFDKLFEAGDRMAGKRLCWTINANLFHVRENFLLDRIDYCVGETHVGSASELWQLVHMLKLADALCLPQIVSPWLPTDAATVDVRAVRRAIAVAYASGHRMLVPWDVYWPSHARWFGTTEEYGDLYRFVRESAALLDGYRPWSNVVLKLPLSTDPQKAYNRAGLACRNIRALAEAGYLCRYAVEGEVGRMVRIPPCQRDFDGNVTVLPATDATLEAVRARCLPAVSVKPSSLVALPREKPNDKSAPLAVHLVNLGNPVSGASLWLSQRIVDGRKIGRATLHQPGKTGISLKLTPTNEGLQIDLPAVDLWGIIEVQSNLPKPQEPQRTKKIKNER